MNRSDFGVNVTADGSDSPPTEVGPWRRLVLSDLNAIATADRYAAGGCKVLGVATREAIKRFGGSADVLVDACGRHLHALQVWNEPDGGGAASDSASKAEYSAWLAAFRTAAAAHDFRGPLVAAGLVSGDPKWLGGIDMDGYRLAIHPYDQRPVPGYDDWGWGYLPDLLDAYRPYLPAGTGFWLTECSRTTTDEAVQARYANALVYALAARRDVEAAMWYCWKDWQLDGTVQPFGMVRGDGSRKDTLNGWLRALEGIVSVDPNGPSWTEDKERIEEQIALLVENQRRILQGKWDEARMFLDAVDPAMAGKWTNVQFPSGGQGGS